MSAEASLDRPLVRSEELWFKDGTIVLQAENILFRVYSGLLSKHSQFFEQLFSLPQPTDAEKYDGCPLIKLAGDAADDTRNFLLMIHEIGYASVSISYPMLNSDQDSYRKVPKSPRRRYYRSRSRTRLKYEIRG